MQVLRSGIVRHSVVFVVNDTLAKFRDHDRERTSSLRAMLELQKETANFDLFATSRPIPEIERVFDSSIHLRTHAHEEDVKKSLDGRLQRSFSHF